MWHFCHNSEARLVRELSEEAVALGKHRPKSVRRGSERGGFSAQAIHQSWLTLARSYEFGERLVDFSRENDRRRREIYGLRSPFFAKEQIFIEPIRCEKCGGRNAHCPENSDRAAQGNFEIRTLHCRDCGHEMVFKSG
jgi:hypothetical protein